MAKKKEKNLSPEENVELVSLAEQIDQAINELGVESTLEVEEPKTLLNRTDPGWTAYVLSLLDPVNEMVRDHPKTDGLRRVAEKLYGTMISETDVIDCPRTDNGQRAVVKVTVAFENGVRCDGVADVYPGNTNRDFAVYASATAETRAEGRALRKALRLVKVLAAEEIGTVSHDEPAFDPISKDMIPGLEVMSRRAKTNAVALAKANGMKIESLDQLTKTQGLTLTNIIGKISRGELEIPEGAGIE